MFKELAILARSTTINLIISADQSDGQMRVIVMPKPATEGENPALSTPLSLVASPEELDEKFAEVIGSYTSTRTNLEDALSASQTVMEAARKQVTEEAAKKVSGRVKSIPEKTAPTTPSIENEADEKETETATAKAVNNDVELF